MKKILFLLLFTATFYFANAQNATTSKKETYDYIQKILNEADGYTITYSKGAIDRITRHDNFWKLEWGYHQYTGVPLNKDLGCTDYNVYQNIDFAKLIGEPKDYELDQIASNSSLKKIVLFFTENSVLKSKGGDCSDAHSDKPVSSVIFVYRNEEGVKNRLIKAILYLSKIRKEEENNKSDPFGN